MTTIVIPDDFPPVMRGSAAFRAWAPTASIAYHDDLPAGEDGLIDRLQGAGAAICIRASTHFTETVFERCGGLRLISLWGTGTDNVNLDAAVRHGVTVTNTPAVAADSIAEHCLTLMLAVARGIPSVNGETKNGNWPRGRATQVRGKTLGVIGLGAIGSRFARLGKAIGMNVLSWTMHPRPRPEFDHVPLERLYRESDVVSLHLRLSDETRGLIGKEQFALMKSTSILVNTARGPIVDERALIEALRNGRIAGAGLDVFDKEPLPANHPFATLDNVVLTPHSAGITAEALEAGLRMAIDNVANFLRGAPTNVVVSG